MEKNYLDIEAMTYEDRINYRNREDYFHWIEARIVASKKLFDFEVEDYFWEANKIDKIRHEPRRWTYKLEHIFLINNEYYSLYMERGLTEIQESEYPSQIARKVEPRTRTIEIMEWVEV